MSYRAIIDRNVGPMMDMERVADSVARAYRDGSRMIRVRAMVTTSRERDLTAREQERLVALATARLA